MKGVSINRVLTLSQDFQSQIPQQTVESPLPAPSPVQVLPQVLQQNFAVLDFNSLAPNTNVDFVEVVRNAKNDLKNRFIFEAVASNLPTRRLLSVFEPVQVGFGVVITPDTIQQALLVIANATILTTKQVMAKAIVDTLQALTCASLDREFFFGYLNRILANLLNNLTLLDVDVERLILRPAAATISRLIIEDKEDATEWGVSEIDKTVGKRIFSDDEENLAIWLGFLKESEIVGASLLNYAFYETLMKTTTPSTL